MEGLSLVLRIVLYSTEISVPYRGDPPLNVV